MENSTTNEVAARSAGSPADCLFQKSWNFEQNLNYRGNWALATSSKDRCEIQMCIMASDLLCDQKVKTYLDLAKIWERRDKANEMV